MEKRQPDRNYVALDRKIEKLQENIPDGVLLKVELLRELPVKWSYYSYGWSSKAC